MLNFNLFSVLIPVSTLADHHTKSFYNAAVKYNRPIECVTADGGKPKSLLSEPEIDFLSDLINNKGWHDSNQDYYELAQSNDFKQCENHYDYLVRQKKLKGLKRDGGRVSFSTGNHNQERCDHSRAAAKVAYKCGECFSRAEKTQLTS